MGHVQASRPNRGAPPASEAPACWDVGGVLALSGQERPPSACGCPRGSPDTGWMSMRPDGLGLGQSGTVLASNPPSFPSLPNYPKPWTCYEGMPAVQHGESVFLSLGVRSSSVR